MQMNPVREAGEEKAAAGFVALGLRFYKGKRLAEARACFQAAVNRDPGNATAHNLLGWTQQCVDRTDDAISSYTEALEIDPDFQEARRNLAVLLTQKGRRDESLRLWRQDVAVCPGTYKLLQKLLTRAMGAADLTLAGEYAAIMGEIRWGGNGTSAASLPAAITGTQLTVTIPKLRHDIEQFEHLQALRVFGAEYTEIVTAYRAVLERLIEKGPDARVVLDEDLSAKLGETFSKILYVRPTARVSRALSQSWDPAIVEREYLKSRTGIVVIDDFLSPTALAELQAFCLESTVWTGNRYAHGRIGAFMQDGFCCPLLLQIAEEIRDVLPRVIGKQYPLKGLWGFKTPETLPAEATIHADFAAVNLNFWITPDTANLEPGGGGLVIYDVDAPLNWDFHMYNGRSDLIIPFLWSRQSKTLNVPYRQNRAVLFNSDLFHASGAVRFKPGYENRRTNITMLFGERQNDVHHPDLARSGSESSSGGAWRSAAFSRR